AAGAATAGPGTTWTTGWTTASFPPPAGPRLRWTRRPLFASSISSSVSSACSLRRTSFLISERSLGEGRGALGGAGGPSGRGGGAGGGGGRGRARGRPPPNLRAGALRPAPAARGCRACLHAAPGPALEPLLEARARGRGGGRGRARRRRARPATLAARRRG